MISSTGSTTCWRTILACTSTGCSRCRSFPKAKQGDLMKMRALRSFLSLPLIVALAAFASGCATVKDAPLRQNDASVDVSAEALEFMTARLKNDYKPDYAPRILTTFVQSASGAKEMLSFKADYAYDSGKGYNEHLVAFKLVPGSYQVRQIFAMTSVFPFNATFAVPIFQMIEVKKAGVYYLGR